MIATTNGNANEASISMRSVQAFELRDDDTIARFLTTSTTVIGSLYHQLNQIEAAGKAWYPG